MYSGSNVYMEYETDKNGESFNQDNLNKNSCTSDGNSTENLNIVDNTITDKNININSEQNIEQNVENLEEVVSDGSVSDESLSEESDESNTSNSELSDDLDDILSDDIATLLLKKKDENERISIQLETHSVMIKKLNNDLDWYSDTANKSSKELLYILLIIFITQLFQIILKL